MLARTKDTTINNNRTSEQINNNGNPDCSNISHATVATTIIPNEIRHRFHKSISAANENNNQNFIN